MSRPHVHAITGAFGYSGREIARLLLARGERVRTLTGHPDRPDPFGGRVEVEPFRFDDPSRMREALAGVRVLYNTYWVRFDHGASTFARAVENSRALFRAAAEAGVERVVHVSITNPASGSPLPYFRGKAEVERALRESGLSHAILRPAVFFGGRDVLINNIAWLLRRLPVFGVARGAYGIQPVHVEDVARLAVEQGERGGDVVLDAVGPEVFAFDELVRLVRAAVRSRAAIVPVPRWLLLGAARALRAPLGDVVLTKDEVEGLTANLLVSGGPPTAVTSFTEWLAAHADGLGIEWASELGRHYR
ncbi:MULTISPECIES: SDR family oxidoreductase [Anaeromyxobacter]|uniref:SDR family oxidoreductase n=1 Tax=Anaeromyxobacter TaxID=161492 RepID=UPI001F5702EB|nr:MULTISPECIES: NAD(P)H-binding protein [unclassified Anaeromyxobacter]